MECKAELSLVNFKKSIEHQLMIIDKLNEEDDVVTYGNLTAILEEIISHLP